MTAPHVLRAADGLTLHLDASGICRVAWGEGDWFGPGGLTIRHDGARFAGGHTRDGVAPLALAHVVDVAGNDDLGPYAGVELEWSGLPFPLRTVVRAYAQVPVLVFRLEAPGGLAGPAAQARRAGTPALPVEREARRFEEPIVAWPHFAPLARAAGGIADGAVSYGHQWSEFALPVFGDASCSGYLFAPHRPPVVTPLMLIAPDRRTLLLGALDGFHEQIIAVPRAADAAAEGVRCGWHGDLVEAPPGFATELAVWAAAGPRAALDAWTGCLRRRHATVRPSRYADAGLARLSYWTDNGA
jgi:hypothetical protein